MNAAPLPSKRYAVILADPPWRFEPWSRKTGMSRAADNHYETMTVDAICDLAIGYEIARKNAVLFLWATVPMLTDALCVMEYWDFTYKSHLVWDKNTVGTGYWFRNRHELLLLGTRGKVRCPTPGTQWPSLVCHPRGKHSAKPAVFHEIIERYFPNESRIELFARGLPQPGWDVWGLEAWVAEAAE